MNIYQSIEMSADNDNNNEIFFIAKRYTVHHK